MDFVHPPVFPCLSCQTSAIGEGGLPRPDKRFNRLSPEILLSADLVESRSSRIFKIQNMAVAQKTGTTMEPW